MLTVEDFLAARSFPDDIARNAYYIDIHLATSKSDMTFNHLPPGVSHGVPYRIMLPVGINNLWVAGRSVSSDRAVQGSLRVMPNCFSMGQACGTAAALALRDGEIHAASPFPSCSTGSWHRMCGWGRISHQRMMQV